MAGRARANQAAEPWPPSWMRFRTCSWCGNGFCVNNYSDRVSRVPKFRGFITCAFCIKLIKSPLLKKYFQYIDKLKCTTGKKKCKCPTCKFNKYLRKLLE